MDEAVKNQIHSNPSLKLNNFFVCVQTAAEQSQDSFEPRTFYFYFMFYFILLLQYI